VELIAAYSKRRDRSDALVSPVRQLRQAQERSNGTAFSVRSTQASSQWRVGDRLSETDTARLIAAFTAGTSKRKLAERYAISESSVKRLIRQHGASKLSSGLSRCWWRYRSTSCAGVTSQSCITNSGYDFKSM
jgi:hypothetical protein